MVAGLASNYCGLDQYFGSGFSIDLRFWIGSLLELDFPVWSPISWFRHGQWTTIWKPFWMPFRNNHLAAMVCLGFMQNRGMPRMIIEHLQHMKASYFIRSLSIRFHYAASAIAFKSISKFLQSAFVKSLSRLTSNTFFFFAFSLMMFNVFNASRLV